MPSGECITCTYWASTLRKGECSACVMFRRRNGYARPEYLAGRLAERRYENA